jgi:predicted glycoside hydrolase/deacetylase ChbG (UPF0249 family)
VTSGGATSEEQTGLVEKLGFAADARVVIVAADGLGWCHSANDGVYQALREGVVTTAGLQVPCPWAREAAARYRGEDVGVALTLNAEHDLYRWGPLTHGPSLLDGDGGFPRTVGDVWDHADIDEVRRECRAQIERAVLYGFDVTFLSSHLDVLAYRPEFFDVALELAVDFGLPLRPVPTSEEIRMGFPAAKLAAGEGVVMPDRVVVARRGTDAGSAVDRLVAGLPAGVTELLLRPAADLPELRAFARDWSDRVHDLDLVRDTGGLGAALGRHGVASIGYRALRDLQRSR